MKALALLQQAAEFERRSQPAEALAAYEKAVAGEPSNIEALIGLARLQLEQGRTEPSIKALRRVVTLAPNLPIGHALLGMALARAGEPRDALAAFERASAAGNPPPVVLLHMADVLGTLGRHADALAAFDQLLSADASNVIAWNNRGLTLEAMGRDAEAADSFRRALALRPGTPEVHFSLANVLTRFEKYDEAVEHYRQAVAANPGFARAYANLGSALFKLGRWREAEENLTRAARLDPAQNNNAALHEMIGAALRHLERDEESLAAFDRAAALDPNNAGILAKKAHLLYTAGRFDEARKSAECAIELQPGDVTPYYVKSLVTRFDAGDPVIAQMERVLAGLDPASQDKQAELHFALGKAYNDTNAFDNAFGHFAAGNAIKRNLLGYDESLTLSGFARVAQVFSSDLMRSKAGQGDASGSPIFIVGMPRSGTTLIEQILASHPQISGAGEQNALADATNAAAKPGGPAYPEMVQQMAAADLGAIGASYLARMRPRTSGAPRFTDKMPGNYYYAGLIHLTLPNAKIIHARRNPVDTCLSIFTTNFETQHRYSHDLAELGRFYLAYERLMAHWRSVLPGGVMLDLQYEDIVADIETHARRLISFCGLPWNDACLDFHKQSRAVRTASAFQVRQPLYRSSVERWRSYQSRLGPLLAALETR